MKASSTMRKAVMLLCLIVAAGFGLPGMGSGYAMAAENGTASDASETVSITETETKPETVKNVSLPSADDRLELFMEERASELVTEGAYSGRAEARSTRGKRLTGNDKIIYDYLKKEIAKIANGETEDTLIQMPMIESGLVEQTSYTAEELGVDSIIADGKIAQDAMTAFQAKFSYDQTKICRALMADLPYDFYWFDKTAGYGLFVNGGYAAHYDYEKGDYVLAFADDVPVLNCRFYVAKAYSRTGEKSTTKIDTAKTAAPVAAAEKAAEIVKTHAGEPDLEKLYSYKDEICSLTSYNKIAAMNSSTPYGDPWQMIYVFDGDDSTEVVCEGYSKAFQFLCDLSTFRSRLVESHLVVGEMNGGPHMWNIVRMDNNKNYIADVTNCDAGTVGEPDELFLAGAKAGGSVQGGYTFECFTDVEYVYSEDTLSDYDESELVLESVRYAPCAHSMVETKAKVATCEADGNKAYWTCSKCGLVYGDANGETELNEDDIAVPALGHDWDDGKVTTEPTCTEAGVRTYSCSRCDKTRTEKVSALGHDYESEYKPDKEATCTADGSESKHCARCGESLEGSARKIAAFGHDWDDGKVTTEATCTKNGVKTYHCSRCDATKTEKINATGHSYGEWNVTTEPTCTDKGSREKVCIDCGDIVTEDVDATGHSWGAWTVTKKATTEAEGVETRVCKNDPSHKETRPIRKLKLAPGADSKQMGADGTAVGAGASAVAAEKALLAQTSDVDPKGAVFEKLKLKSTKQTKKSVTITWTKVSGATKYVIYGNKCGKNVKKVKLGVVSGNSKTFQAVAGKKVKKGTYYKFIVVALDKNDRVVSTSMLIHAATKGGKVGNPKSVKVKKAVVKKAAKLKKGKTLKLKAKQVAASKKLKIRKHVNVRYESSNAKIATVSKKGVVKGKSKGTCYVYAYAQNGVAKKIKIKVR